MTRTAALLALLSSVPLLAAAPDPRLAAFRKAYVVPVDELGDDRAVAVCLARILHDQTPVEVVASKDEADVVLKVSSHLPSATTKALMGVMGGSPSAHLYAELPDGTKIWDDGAKLRRSMAKQGTMGAGSGDQAKSVECGLAEEVAGTLRDAMRAARDKAKR